MGELTAEIQVAVNQRITITISNQVYLLLSKESERNGNSLSSTIAEAINQQLDQDLPSNQGSKRLTISLPEAIYLKLLRRKAQEGKSLSGLVSCMLEEFTGAAYSGSP